MKKKSKYKISGITDETIQEILSDTKGTSYMMLLNYNHKFIHNIVKKFNNRDYDNYDELFQEGVIALWKALQKFEIGRGINFSTFAYVVIKNACLIYINGENKIRNNEESIELKSSPNDKENFSKTNIDIVYNKSIVSLEDRVINKIDSELKFEGISNFERKIYNNYVSGMTKKEAAKRLGISVSAYAVILYKHILPKIKNNETKYRMHLQN